MNRLKLLFTILFLFISTVLYPATKRYKIELYVESNSAVVLERLQWNKKVEIATLQPSGKGRYIFKGKEPLIPGEYSIKYEGGSFQFFISGHERQNESFLIKEQLIEQKKGSRENSYLAEFQNFLTEGWRSLESAGQMQQIIDSLYFEVSENLPNSLLYRFLEMASSQKNIYNLLSDSRINNTTFARNYLVEHLKRVEYSIAESAIEKIDTLIAKSANNIKPLVAEEAFDLFYKSKIMGHEAVACHIAQNYFLNNALSLEDKDKLYSMRTFVMFTKESLIGNKAPELNLEDTLGNRVSLREFIHNGEYTILYFYTDDCANCNSQTPLIMEQIDNYSHGVLNFYSVYTGSSSTKWKEYINDNFFSYNPFVNWANLWDSASESAYHLLYGVISTPKLFLIDRHGVILAREIDAQILGQLLEGYAKEREEFTAFFNNYFKGGPFSQEYLSATIDLILNTVHRESDKLFIKTADELYLYLAYADDYLLQESAMYLVENHILPNSELWQDEYYIEQLKEAVEAFNMNRVGEVAANLQLVNEGGAPMSLSDIKSNYKLLYFYKPNCGICTHTTHLLKELYSKYSMQLDCSFIAINTANRREEWLKYIIDNDLQWINLWDDTKSSVIFENYFLKEVPQLYLLDKDNVVLAKGITPIDLEEIFKALEIREKQ